MKRIDLVEFLGGYLRGEKKQYWMEIADALIREGYVKVDVPQEFLKCKYCGMIVHPGEIHTAHVSGTRNDFIRFLEVIE